MSEQRDIELVLDRWLRRYAGRRWLATGFYNARITADEVGMRRDQVRLGIALRRVWHALRPALLRLARWVNRWGWGR